MKQKFLKFCTSVKDKVVNASRRAKLMFSGAVATVLAPVKALAQELAGTGYDAGTNALEEVASELVKYVPMSSTCATPWPASWLLWVRSPYTSP